MLEGFLLLRVEVATGALQSFECMTCNLLESWKTNRRDNFWTNLGFGACFNAVRGWSVRNFWKKGKGPHPQDKIQHLDFTKDPRPLYYKPPPCVFHHKNVCSKAVFGP